MIKINTHKARGNEMGKTYTGFLTDGLDIKKAILKVNYTMRYAGENLKGKAFEIEEEFENFVALNVFGSTIDFRRTEIQIIK